MIALIIKGDVPMSRKQFLKETNTPMKLNFFWCQNDDHPLKHLTFYFKSLMCKFNLISDEMIFIKKLIRWS